ncbi:MAG: DUF4783 domain-containing protein [Bacteroidetes bacterium]|nr:MAG: DUF4783 domain-containing protein [Bacteroidota bacterium]
MKSTVFKNAIMALIILGSSSLLYADVFDDVVNALKTQNAREVSKYLNSTVDLTINNQEGVCSKQQAEMMIKNFLAKYPAKNITIQHKGSSAQGAKYAIANYETEQTKFRVYIFLKMVGNQMLVHEMRIEKE